MLSTEQIEFNKHRFINLINSIEREGFNKNLLLSHLENSDFYVAPSSTKYHGSYKGGLCNHCLNVYDNLTKLSKMCNVPISDDSLKIVSIFHDISKMNYYEVFYKNQKVYSENGPKVDAGGRYDWVQTSDYKVRDINDRFLYCNKEVTSEYIARQYCNLTLEESVAILHSCGGMGDDSVKDSVNSIFTRYPLALLLYMAEMLSCYLILE